MRIFHSVWHRELQLLLQVEQYSVWNGEWRSDCPMSSAYEPMGVAADVEWNPLAQLQHPRICVCLERQWNQRGGSGYRKRVLLNCVSVVRGRNVG